MTDLQAGPQRLTTGGQDMEYIFHLHFRLSSGMTWQGVVPRHLLQEYQAEQIVLRPVSLDGRCSMVYKNQDQYCTQGTCWSNGHSWPCDPERM